MPTPRRGRSVLSDVTALCGGGRPAFWSQRFRITDVDGGVAIVYHRMLPRPRRHLDFGEYRCSSQGVPLGCRTTGGGGPEHQPGRAGGRLEGGRDSGSADNGGDPRNVRPLPPATVPMVPGRENMEDGLDGEGGEVPDGLHHRDKLLSLLECNRPGPTA